MSKPLLCPSIEAGYPKAPHSAMMQVPVFAASPPQIAEIRVGLAARSLAPGAQDVICSTGRCKTGRVGFEVVNQKTTL